MFSSIQWNQPRSLYELGLFAIPVNPENRSGRPSRKSGSTRAAREGRVVFGTMNFNYVFATTIPRFSLPPPMSYFSLPHPGQIFRYRPISRSHVSNLRIPVVRDSKRVNTNSTTTNMREQVLTPSPVRLTQSILHDLSSITLTSPGRNIPVNGVTPKPLPIPIGRLSESSHPAFMRVSERVQLWESRIHDLSKFRIKQINYRN
jgi:hypothetical protein